MYKIVSAKGGGYINIHDNTKQFEVISGRRGILDESQVAHESGRTSDRMELLLYTHTQKTQLTGNVGANFRNKCSLNRTRLRPLFILFGTESRVFFFAEFFNRSQRTKEKYSGGNTSVSAMPLGLR